jgi:hypothetical protein
LAFIGLIAVIAAIRVGARRVAAGDGRFVWLVVLPSLLASGAVVVLGVEVASSSIALGALMVAVGLVLVAATVRMSSQMAAAVSRTPRGGDITPALVEPLANFALLWGILLAAGALLAVVALIAWGVFGR